MMAAARLELDELLENVRRTLAPAEHAIRSHRYLDVLAAGRVPESSLRALAGEQFSIISSDRRSFAHLAGRFPEPGSERSATKALRSPLARSRVAVPVGRQITCAFAKNADLQGGIQFLAPHNRSRRSLLGTTKCWPCKSNPVRLGSYVSRAGGALGDCGLSAGVLAAGPVKTP